MWTHTRKISYHQNQFISFTKFEQLLKAMSVNVMFPEPALQLPKFSKKSQFILKSQKFIPRSILRKMGKCEITKPEWLEITQLRRPILEIFCDVIICRKIWLSISFFVNSYFSVRYVLSSSFPIFSFFKNRVHATESKIFLILWKLKLLSRSFSNGLLCLQIEFTKLKFSQNFLGLWLSSITVFRLLTGKDKIIVYDLTFKHILSTLVWDNVGANINV